MEMIRVSGVVVGAKRGAEPITGRVANVVQELCFGVIFIPILQQSDARAVGQIETRDINRTGRCMCAHSFCARNATAVV